MPTLQRTVSYPSTHRDRGARSHPVPRSRRAWGVAALLLVLIGWYGLRLAAFLAYAVRAVADPFELNYGEGIVWQQMAMIPGPSMYGPIDHAPFIVFHYPPVYHLVVHALAWFGADPLAAGRGVSVVATWVLAASLGWIAGQAAPSSRGSAAFGGVIAALSVFTFQPVLAFAALMRVDLLGMALSVLGLTLGVLSLRRPRLLYAAVLLFVVALFTKQTLVAAPVAVLCVWLMRDPGLALRALGLGVLLGLAALLALEWVTDGGFLRHIILYNINRFEWRRAYWAVVHQRRYVVILAVTLGMIGLALWQGRRRLAALADDAPAFVMLVLQFCIAGAMIATAGKYGAAANYFMEALCLCGVFAGMAVAAALDVAARPGGPRAPALLLLAALMTQIALSPLPPTVPLDNPDRARDMAALLAEMRASAKPVLSDDMVLPMRAGLGVTIEPMIFADLTALGQWDPRGYKDLVDREVFSFVLTEDPPGDPEYEERYQPAIRGAIAAHYPVVTRAAGYYLHRPGR